MADFTLQLLHAADQEGGIPALEDAPRFSAVLNALKNEDKDADGNVDFPNTLVLSSGDAYIPGPFFSASETAFGGQGQGDILIQNELGFQAIAFGNHEFDLGTGTVADLIAPDPDSNYPGALFPYLSSNLDFSTDENLAPLVVADGQEASDIPNSIAGNTIITVNGERIGVVGATTPTLDRISSPGDVGIAPVEFDSANPDDIAALAAEIQTSVDSLLADNPDINKVVLLAHMQQIAIEQQLAELFSDVDIIVAGGSNTILADETDRLRAGDEAAGAYPILKTDAEGNPVAVVNTDGNYRYVGRLVVDFDENGIIIPESIDPNVSGAYATDEQGVADVGGTPDPEIVEITDALEEVIAAQEGNIFGSTEVFLNGTRGDVRTQETNLGNLTADANLAAAKEVDSDVVISLKNGGGIRDNIGVVTFPPGSTDPEDALRLPPQPNPLAGKEEGEISQLDIQNSLRFNNGLTLLTLTAEELLAVIEHGVAATEEGATPGRFPQVGGLAFSFDDELPPGDRVQSLAIQDDQGNIIDVVVEDGELVGDPSRTFRLVTLGFLADGGDGYPFTDLANPNRVDLEMEGTQTGDATFADDGTEQDALAEFLLDNFSDTPFMREDVPPGEDTRIQNLDFREDTVLTGAPGGDEDMMLVGGDDADSLVAGNGDDVVAGGLGDDTIEGLAGDDVLRGDLNSRSSQVGIGGDDIIFGGAGSDRIGGKGGNDQLFGEAGDDLLWGDDGDDLLRGGLGNDRLVGDDFSGGTGSDTFVLAVGEGTDTIVDFSPERSRRADFIGLADGLTFGQLTVTQDGSDALISVGDETLAILLGVDASTLTESAFTVI
jgi:2',3'-cyclic-nucleotide 2'-phosphodiesterase (5'-nucleotidase family)